MLVFLKLILLHMFLEKKSLFLVQLSWNLHFNVTFFIVSLGFGQKDYLNSVGLVQDLLFFKSLTE